MPGAGGWDILPEACCCSIHWYAAAGPCVFEISHIVCAQFCGFLDDPEFFDLRGSSPEEPERSRRL